LKAASGSGTTGVVIAVSPHPTNTNFLLRI
jgi:hypothetical protein